MAINRFSISKKQLIVTLTFVVLLAGTNYITFYITQKNTSRLPTNVVASNKDTVTALKPASPEIIKKDSNLPKDTISPNTITKDLNQYADKDVLVRGIVIKNSQNGYSTVDQYDTSKPGLVIEPASQEVTNKLASHTSDEKTSGTPVTLSSKLQLRDQGNGNKTVVLVVSKVD